MDNQSVEIGCQHDLARQTTGAPRTGSKVEHVFLVLAGTRQPPNTCAPWLGTSKKHRVEEGTVHFQIMAFLESRGGHATVAEIAAAVPTSEPIGDYLREMVYQGIIVQ
jgi:hypothetical protein